MEQARKRSIQPKDLGDEKKKSLLSPVDKKKRENPPTTIEDGIAYLTRLKQQRADLDQSIFDQVSQILLNEEHAAGLPLDILNWFKNPDNPETTAKILKNLGE